MRKAKFVESLLNGSKRILIDEEIVIGLENLPRNAPITVHAQVEEKNSKFSAYSHYTSSSEGVLRLDHDPSIGGSYTGVEPMGLFWSMEQNPGQRSGLRLLKQDVTQPMLFHLKAFEGHLTLEEVLNCADCELCSCDIKRWYLAEHIVRQPVREGKIRGTLFLPDVMGTKFQAVIDMFGTGGGLFEHRAALLASRGFMVLSLALFRYEDLPDAFDFVDLDYTEAAVQFLSSHQKNISTAVGVIGLSKGAEIALQMSILFDNIKAVVIINGSPMYFNHPMIYKNKQYQYFRLDKTKVIFTEEGIDFSATAPPEEGAKEWIIPVERSSAEYLIINCTLDRQAPLFTGKLLTRRLALAGEGSRGRAVLYKGAGHLLEPPYAPLCSSGYHRLVGTLVKNGGEPKAHNEAQVHSWKLIQDFLKRRLAPTKSAL